MPVINYNAAQSEYLSRCKSLEFNVRSIYEKDKEN